MDLAFPEGVGFGNCNVCVYDYNQGQLELLQVIGSDFWFRGNIMKILFNEAWTNTV